MYTPPPAPVTSADIRDTITRLRRMAALYATTRPSWPGHATNVHAERTCTREADRLERKLARRRA